jgi:drug/metabolite transporter (DMT)-like permease
MIAFILIFSGYFLQKLTADYYINREILPVEGNIFLLNYKMYLPGFILYATGICFLFINLCIYALNNVENKKYMNLLNAISGAKYSIYTWHLVLGIITRKIFTSESFSNKYLLLAYILMNMYFSVWAILQWKKKVTDLGPIEWIMKRLSSSVRN